MAICVSWKEASENLRGLLLLSPQVTGRVPLYAFPDINDLAFHLFLFNECLTPSNLESDYLPCTLSFCFPLGGPGERLPTISLPSPNKPGALVPLHCRRMDVSPAAVLAFW